jgi:hypothetical protein
MYNKHKCKSFDTMYLQLTQDLGWTTYKISQHFENLGFKKHVKHS